MCLPRYFQQAFPEYSSPVPQKASVLKSRQTLTYFVVMEREKKKTCAVGWNWHDDLIDVCCFHKLIYFTYFLMCSFPFEVRSKESHCIIHALLISNKLMNLWIKQSFSSNAFLVINYLLINIYIVILLFDLLLLQSSYLLSVLFVAVLCSLKRTWQHVATPVGLCDWI